MVMKKPGVDFLECAEEAKELLLEAGFDILDEREFDSHFQYLLKKDGTIMGYLRFYKSKEGTTIDASQVRDSDSVRAVLDGYADVVEKEEKESKAKDVQAFDVIGTDESGKGDYFGPLVVAAVYIPDEETRDELLNLGVADSKKLSDSKVARLSDSIKGVCPHAVVRLPPSTYNRLYGDFNNLNKLMGWAHARAIEDLLEDGFVPEAVLSDKFGSEDLIRDQLMDKGKDIELNQEVRAESNVAVACASVLARAEFLERLSGLGIKFGVEFPKGAGEQVVEAGKEFVSKYGKDELEKVAKLHFKTTEKL